LVLLQEFYHDAQSHERNIYYSRRKIDVIKNI